LVEKKDSAQHGTSSPKGSFSVCLLKVGFTKSNIFNNKFISLPDDGDYLDFGFV